MVSQAYTLQMFCFTRSEPVILHVKTDRIFFSIANIL
jgi:hypothetical protein